MSSTGDELRTFFERWYEYGDRPMFDAYVDKLQEDGTLGADAADLLRGNDRYAIEQELQAGTAKAGSPIICIFWPPRTG